MAIRVAMIGAGSMAKEHLRAFADIPDVIIPGIHSRTRSKAETLAKDFNIPQVCAGVQELHDKTAADLVIVAVPELAARAVAEACFVHPWTVFMEKPAGYHLADAQAILAAAREKKRRVWVGLNRRFLSSTQLALRDLEAQPGPRFIHVQDQQSLETASAIGHPKEVVENWMFANSIHVIDYLSMFGRGGVKSVQRIWPWRGADSHHVVAAIEFQSGDRGLYEGIWRGPGPWAVTITTPKKRWEFRPLEQGQFQNAGERKLQAAELHEWDKTFKPGFRFQAQEVVNALCGKPSQIPTLVQATDTMKLIHQIFQS